MAGGTQLPNILGNTHLSDLIAVIKEPEHHRYLAFKSLDKVFVFQPEEVRSGRPVPSSFSSNGSSEFEFALAGPVR